MAVDFDVTSFSPPLLELVCNGTLDQEDYETFIPAVDAMVKKYGTIRLMVHLVDFEGWTAGALWEDINVDLRHLNHIERLAVVGEGKWKDGLASFAKPFTSAKVRFFDGSEVHQARCWLKESPHPSASRGCSPRA